MLKITKSRNLQGTIETEDETLAASKVEIEE